MDFNGKFVWHDLMTSDVAKSISFYSELLGWGTEDFDMGEKGTYRMIKVGEKTIGGFMPKPPGVEAPNHWMGYVNVADVDQAAERASKHGGTVLMPPMDIPSVGRFAVVADPQGAVLAPFKGGEGHVDKEEPPGLLEFCWDEALVKDPENAVRFYGEVIGWRFEERSMGEMGQYWVARRSGDKDAAGLMKLAPEMGAPPHWLSYVFVADLDATTNKVGTIGGKVIVPPMPVPGIGRVSIIQDNLGAVIGLFGDPATP